MDFVLNKVLDRYQQYRTFGLDINALKRKLEELNCLKEDIKSRKKVELQPRKKLKRQVEHWLGNVERINTDVVNLVQEAGASNFFSCGSSIEKIFRVKEDLEGLIQRGSFSDGLVIDDPSGGGVLWDMSSIIGEAMEETLNRVWELLMDDKGKRVIGIFGMGGVGKTTIMKEINNRLQTEMRKSVKQVTVS